MSNLKIGDQAPTISSKDQNGNFFSLASLKGKKIVLYFYPKDNTPGCTKEACNLRDNYEKLQDHGLEVVGVSPDNEKSHLKFIEKFNLPFTLLADTEKKIVTDYGVWGDKKFMGKTYKGVKRTTFIINEKGIISDIITKVKTVDHTRQIIK